MLTGSSLLPKLQISILVQLFLLGTLLLLLYIIITFVLISVPLVLITGLALLFIFHFCFSFLFPSFFFFLFRVTLAAYGGSQARGRIGVTAASLRHTHSNARSKPRLGPTPQLKTMPDPQPTE